MTVQTFFHRRRSRFLFGLLFFSGFYYGAATLVDYHLLNSFQAIPAAFAWLATNFMPTTRSMAFLPLILTKLGQTIILSITATVIAAILALALAIIGSSTTGLNRATKLLARVIASICRNIPLVAWAMILLLSFKQSDFTGFLALFFGSFGYLTRSFMELIESYATAIYEALSTTGASYLQVVLRGIIPSISASLLSWLLYMIENNIRDATLVGILTGTGIGFLFDLYYKSFRFDLAGMTTVTIIVAVVCLELLANQIRRLIR
jgi:phosphonate transport system permease protein